MGDLDESVIPDQVVAVLRELRLLDTDGLRLAFRIRAHHDGAALAADADELDELIGSVAAETNHEPDRRRRQRLDSAYDRLGAAAPSSDGR